MTKVLPNSIVGNELTSFTRLKINLATVSKEIKKKYRIAKYAPQLLIFDCKGKYMYRTTQKDPKRLAAMLKKAIKKSKAIEKRDLKKKK